MTSSWKQHFQATLQGLLEAEALRERKVHTVSDTSSTNDSSSGRRLDFGSNDYLGLRAAPALRVRVSELLSQPDGVWGSGASPVLSGYTAAHAALEALLSELSGSSAALLFSSGYSTNVGTLACLADQSDAIYSDQLNHASLIDGMRLSRAERVIFPHGEMEFLETHLAAHRHRFQRVILVTESVFSMDGDCADLPKLVDLAQRYDCGLVVDEAHATGVYGRHGGGLLEEFALEGTERLPLLLKLGTLSKAVGGIGGFAAGDQEVIDFLVNRCRSYLFSTSPPAATMVAAAAAIELLRGMQAERLRLRAMSRALRGRLHQASLAVPPGDSPIVPIVVGSERAALHFSQRLSAAGIYVPAIRPPTVAAGTSRLRISLSALHSQEDVDLLLQTLLEV